MTREDKQYVINICRILADKMDDSGKVAVEQVISAIRDLEEQLPEQEPVFYPQVDGITPTVVRQEPREDAISRQAALDAMSDTWKHICFVARRRKPTKGEEAVYSDMVGTVKNLPPVNPQEPKTGRWINRHIIANKSIDMIVCSECGEEFSYDAETGISEYNYCPNCGAKMIDPQESEE